jgi:hypothetical protein
MAKLLLALFFLTLMVGPTYAQSCNPAAVHYIVRDEKGNVLSETDLKSIAELVPKQIGDATTSVGETSFAPDNVTFYWPESIEWDKGTKVPSLDFSNAGICALRFSEITLTYHNKKMRLIFDLEILRFQEDRRPVVNSIPFQAGTFRLDLRGWKHDRDKMIPATHWKKVK